MWHDPYIAATIEDVLAVLQQYGEKARLIAGATDLILEMERGVRKGIEELVDVSRIPHQDLMALGASVMLRSTSGSRVVPLEKFYLGVRKVDLHPDEMLVDIRFPVLKPNQRGTFIKFALRRAQAISLVNAAVVLTMNGDVVESASITLGAVAPTIIHAAEAEAFLEGKQLTAEVVVEAAAKTGQASRPISDVRSSAGYRRRMVEVITRRALIALANRQEKAGYPLKPVTLRSNGNGRKMFIGPSVMHTREDVIETTINGNSYRFETGQNKTLLRLLREEGGLIGTKEGCAEGEG